jgi:hypothetical protein
VTRFIDHLYTRLGTTSNYSAITNLHNSQITTEPVKPFPVCYVFTSLFLATASNNVDSSASRAHAILSCLPSHNWTGITLYLAYNISARTTQETPRFICYSPTVTLLRIRCLATGTCLPSCCPETGLVYPPISWSLRSNGSTSHNIKNINMATLKNRAASFCTKLGTLEYRLTNTTFCRALWVSVWFREVLNTFWGLKYSLEKNETETQVVQNLKLGLACQEAPCHLQD